MLGRRKEDKKQGKIVQGRAGWVGGCWVKAPLCAWKRLVTMKASGLYPL